MLIPIVIKRDGSRVAFDSVRIKEAVQRAAIAAGIEDHLTDVFEECLLGLGLLKTNAGKIEKKKITIFLPQYGIIELYLFSIKGLSQTIPICELLFPVTTIQLLKASGRLARSPPLIYVLRITFLKLKRVEFYHIFEVLRCKVRISHSHFDISVTKNSLQN